MNELLIQLHLLGWVRDTEYSIKDSIIYDHPTEYYTWLSFSPIEDGQGIFRMTAVKKLTYLTYAELSKLLIENC